MRTTQSENQFSIGFSYSQKKVIIMLNFLVVEHEDQSNSMLDLDFLKVDTQNRKLVVTDPLVLKRTESISVVIEVESNNKEDRKHDSESSEEFSNYWVFKNQSTIPKTFHLD